MLVATVCALTVGGVALAWVLRIDDARRQEFHCIGTLRAQRSPSPSLPGLLVLRIGFVLQLGTRT